LAKYIAISLIAVEWEKDAQVVTEEESEPASRAPHS
jgi:hypothetical protein